MLLIVPATQPLAGQDLMSYASRDPHGWQNFKWGMSQDATVKLGARLFKDENGINRFGLPKLELLSGKSFWMDLKFYLLTRNWFISSLIGSLLTPARKKNLILF